MVNTCSRENGLFDAFYEGFVAPHRPFDRTIGARPGQAALDWPDLQLDPIRVRSGLAGLGFRIPAPERCIRHWSGYLRTGTWTLYRVLIEDRLPLAALLRVLPDEVEPRRSRLLDGLTPRRDLPGARSAPS